MDSELGLVSRGALEAENPPVLRGGRGGAGGTFWGCPGSAGTRELSILAAGVFGASWRCVAEPNPSLVFRFGIFSCCDHRPVAAVHVCYLFLIFSSVKPNRRMC